MAAPKGNQYWKNRSRSGPRPRFETPEQLWEACVRYFEWVEDTPLVEHRLSGGKLYEVPKMRPMTIRGLCVFLELSEDTWREWRKSREDLSGIITRVEGIVYCQKFEGAAANLFNPNLVARELGLKDKADQHSEPAVNITLYPEDLDL